MSDKTESLVFILISGLMGLCVSYVTKNHVLVIVFTCIALFFVLAHFDILPVIKKWKYLNLESEKKCEFVKCFLVVSVFIFCGSAMFVRSEYLKVELSTVGVVIMIGCFLSFLAYSVVRVTKERKRVIIFKEHLRKLERE